MLILMGAESALDYRNWNLQYWSISTDMTSALKSLKTLFKIHFYSQQLHNCHHMGFKCWTGQKWNYAFPAESCPLPTSEKSTEKNTNTDIKHYYNFGWKLWFHVGPPRPDISVFLSPSPYLELPKYGHTNPRTSDSFKFVKKHDEMLCFKKHAALFTFQNSHKLAYMKQINLTLGSSSIYCFFVAYLQSWSSLMEKIIGVTPRCFNWEGES